MAFEHVGFSATTNWKNATLNTGCAKPWSTPTNAYADGGGYAESTKAGDCHLFHGYNFTEIQGKVVDSVEVRVDNYVEDTDDYIQLEVSCNAGGAWGSTNLPNHDDMETTDIWDITSLGQGGCSSPPTIAQLDDTNFRTRITAIGSGPGGNYWRVDWIPVQVNYTLPVVGFTITLPGESPVDSEPGGNATTGIEFNTTSAYNYTVNPCVKSAGGNCQTSTVPIFNFTNVGNVALNYNVSINASLPSTISLYCSTDNDPTSNTTVTTSEWEVSSSVAQNAWVDLWCWCDYLGIDASEDTQRRFYHNAST